MNNDFLFLDSLGPSPLNLTLSESIHLEMQSCARSCTDREAQTGSLPDCSGGADPTTVQCRTSRLCCQLRKVPGPTGMPLGFCFVLKS